MLSEVDLKDMGYDNFTQSLARYPKEQTNPMVVESMYLALGLVGEAGEASEKVKKLHRDNHFDSKALAYELGDVLYYLTRLANTWGYSLGDIQRMNVEKLTSRRDRGTIHGEGDNR